MKTNHTLLLIFAIIVTVIVGSIYGFMYYRIETSADKIIKNQAQIDSANLAKEREKKFLDTYKATASKWSSLQGLYVRSDEVVGFIEKIESIGPATKTEFNIANLDADNMDNAPFGKEGKIKMHITSKGSWEEVMKSIALVELLPYKLNVNNVKASSYKNQQTQGKNTVTKVIWELSFDLQVSMLSVNTNVSTSTSSIKIK